MWFAVGAFGKTTPANVWTGSRYTMGRLNEPNPSLWVETTPEAAFQPLPGDTTADVVVIGAGIAGLCTAMLLAKAGVHVAVVESGRVASGVTGYTTAKITAQHGLKYAGLLKTLGEDRASMYATANLTAIERIGSLVAELAIDCDFRRMAAYTYTEHDDYVRQIEDEVKACEKLGLRASFVTKTGLPFPVKGAVVLNEQALFHPRKFAQALANAIVEKGGQIFDQTRATDVKEEGAACLVETDRGKISCQQAVIATHLPFPGRGQFYAKTEPSRSYALAYKTRRKPPDGMYISAESPVRSIRPHFLGKQTFVLIGGEGHRVGEEDDTTERYETLEAWSRERFGLADVAHRWSAQDYMPADGVPFIGPIDNATQRIFIATGFGKWGMTSGMVAATIISDRIAGRESPYALAFDSTRVPAKSFMETIGANAETAAHFIGDKLKSIVAPSLEEVGPGEGKIVDHRGVKMAVYKEPAGKVHALAAECTHMGCIVSWNKAELSWDCPCHGSRFDIDGTVIQAPATKDLDAKLVQAEAAQAKFG
jgi:glycine/D-amino acid oxidase-like deaminating enzyme/nitrite reductase/ring-hydroxylating ferredoxin subunit